MQENLCCRSNSTSWGWTITGLFQAPGWVGGGELWHPWFFFSGAPAAGDSSPAGVSSLGSEGVGFKIPTIHSEAFFVQ